MPTSTTQDSYSYPGSYARKTFNNKGLITSYDIWVKEGTTGRVVVTQGTARVADITFQTPPENPANAIVALPAGYVPPAPVREANPADGAMSWHWAFPLRPAVDPDAAYQDSATSSWTTPPPE